jgi:beta-N-acetylhexosaminidase
MLSTAIYTHFSHRPAAFTKAIATRELRGRVGFAGVSITDSLQTTAAASFGGPAKVGVAAAKAGVDLLLFTGESAASKAGHALREKLRAGSLKRAAFEGSVNRVLRLRAKLGE